MKKNLVIVESPTKARTIKRFLPADYVVESSIGHIRDLPQSAKEIPKEAKKNAWARLGIDVENGFKPLYVVSDRKKAQVDKLKALLKDAKTLYLATDEDREGESISWHLVQVLAPKVEVKRMVFHEITRPAILHALEHPRDIDYNLVAAQETRRLLDRLYGYELSPLLWRIIGPSLSAGRVQSAALRMTVERERKRMQFVESHHWGIAGQFQHKGKPFEAKLTSLDDKPLVSGKDFDPTTGKINPKAKDVVWMDEKAANTLQEKLQSAQWKVDSVRQTPYTRRPAPPFTTPTLQQDANRKFGFSSTETMRIAQSLYENGLITYMRTDSTTLSEQALTAARAAIKTRFKDKRYVPERPRTYRSRVKNAQEAHEAIRPTDFSQIDEVKGQNLPAEVKLYELIWQRTLASQMTDAHGNRVAIDIKNQSAPAAIFHAGGSTIEFDGYLRVYNEAETSDLDTAVLPEVKTGQVIDCDHLKVEEHTTRPMPRYTEASLIKELEEKGIGRPSTYASIIETIRRREYVTKRGNALVPGFTAFAVIQLLERYFNQLVNADFTSQMEDALDTIACGEMQSVPYLESFYFGNKREDWVGLKTTLTQQIDARAVCAIPINGQESTENPAVVRVGRYGPFLEWQDKRFSLPPELAPDELTLNKAQEMLEQASASTVLGVDDASGKNVHLKSGRYGAYVQLGENEDEEKPRMKSLFSSMSATEVTFEQALQLLSLPRLVGVDPSNDQEIYADYGRYGPYLKREADTRSLQQPEQVFTCTLEEALAVLAEEKRFRRGSPTVLKEIGAHPASAAKVQVLSGRYGPYVTDGQINASLPRGEDPSAMTMEQAVALLEKRAAYQPTKKAPVRRKAAASKAATKTSAKKTPAKKADAEKTPAKKTIVKKVAAAKTAIKKVATKSKTTGRTAAKKTVSP